MSLSITEGSRLIGKGRHRRAEPRFFIIRDDAGRSIDAFDTRADAERRLAELQGEPA